MEKGKATYLVDPEIEIMSLVELGANHTQVEDGKTVLLMKSAKRIAQENSTGKGKEMTELEAQKRKLEAELAIVNDAISKDGEVTPEDGEKPDGAGEKPAEPETQTDVDTPAEEPKTDDSAVTVESLQAELKAKEEEISGLTADNKKLQSVVDAYYTAVVEDPEEKPEGDK